MRLLNKIAGIIIAGSVVLTAEAAPAFLTTTNATSLYSSVIVYGVFCAYNLYAGDPMDQKELYTGPGNSTSATPWSSPDHDPKGPTVMNMCKLGWPCTAGITLANSISDMCNPSNVVVQASLDSQGNVSLNKSSVNYDGKNYTFGSGFGTVSLAPATSK